MPKLDPQTIMLAFVAVTGLAVLLQTIILFAIYITVRKTAASVKEQVEDLRSSVMPVVYNTRELFGRLAPKVEATVDDLAAIAEGLRIQSAEMQASVTELLDKFRHQTTRLDNLFSSLLDGVDRAGGFVADVVSRPVRQISGLLASVKAIAESLRAPAPPRPPRPRRSDDGDTFI
jgi:ABC-type transporter Mla subunit MlaD